MPVLVDPVTPMLWRACLAGDSTLIDEELRSSRTDAHALDRNGESCLHMAVRGGNTKGLERLLEEGLRIDHANHVNYTIEWKWKGCMHSNVLPKLFTNGQTALHVAANLDNVNIVRTIVQHGGNLDCTTKMLEFSYDNNINLDNINIVGTIAQRGVNMDCTTKFSGMTALHLACRLGPEEMVQILLDNGANCAIRDKVQKWPDHYSTNKTILDTFDKHFDVCTHGRRKLRGGAQSKAKPSITRDTARVAVIDDDTELERLRGQERHGRGRDGPEYGNIQRGEVEIFDEGAQYNPDTGSGDIKRNNKKWKINHKMGFSDQHKQRMQQNVFDRLLHASKKTEST